jgi:hypothetical protein
MEDIIMTGWFPQHDLGKEELAVQAKWARTLAVVYGAALLLLVAFVAASRMVAEPAPGLASATAPHVAHAPAATTRHPD